MNNPNPFVPQGSLLEQKNKKRARVKVAVYSIFAINILVISPLLIQGCKKEAPPTDTSALPADNTPTNAAPDTNLPPVPTTNFPPMAVVSNTPPPAPLPPPPPAAPEPAPGQDYVVAKGDSFYSIAKKFHVKTKEVEAANPGITPAKLKVGQKIQIPAGGSSSGSSATSGSAMGAASDSGSETVVTVKPGDSLAKLAHEHGSTIKLIRSANDLKTDKIKVGQKLKVPAKASSAPVASTPAPEPMPAPAPAPAAVSPPMPPPSVPANGAAR